PSYHKLSMSDVEWFYYTCSVARYNHFSELAKTQTLNPAEATQSYKKAVESLLFYKNNTFQFRSSRPDAIRKFLVKRYYVMRCLQTVMCQPFYGHSFRLLYEFFRIPRVIGNH